jgi:hypothetical protein
MKAAVAVHTTKRGFAIADRRQPAANAGVALGSKMAVEPMETRVLLTAFTPGNLAVLDLAAASKNTTASVLELSPSTAGQSTPVHTIPVSSMYFSSSGTSSFLSDTNDGSLLTMAAYNTQTQTVAISAASWSSGTVTLTTATNYYTVGNSVTVTGMTPSAYNGTYAITAETSTSVKYALAANPGTATTFGTAASLPSDLADLTAANARQVGTLNNSTTYAAQTTYTDTTAGNQARAATSLDDANWYITDKGGIYTNGGSTPISTTSILNARSFGGTVYVASTTAGVGGVSSVSGLTSPTLTGLIPADTKIQDFYFIQSGQDGSTYDVLYTMDQNSSNATINKFSLVGGSWVSNGSTGSGTPYTLTANGESMVAANNGSGGAFLYVTTTSGTVNNSLVRLTDTAGYNSPINITTASNVTLYTDSSGDLQKGLDFVPTSSATTNTAVTTASGSTGNPATLKATVTASSGSAPTSGFVEFWSGSTLLATATSETTSGSVATFTYTGSLPVGTYSNIQSVYLTPGTGYASSASVAGNGPTITVNAAPTVTASTANIGTNATSITISGSGFSATPANDSVTFNLGAVGTVTAATANSLTVSLTTDPTSTGNLTAVVTVSGTSSGSAVQVATVVTPPTTTSSTANILDTATTLTIAGTNFDTTAAHDSVTFSNGVTGTVTSATATSLTVGSLTGLSAVATGTPLNASVTVDGVSSGTAVQVATVAPQTISYATVGSAYTQTFSTLPSTGGTPTIVTDGASAGPFDLTVASPTGYGASGLTGWYHANIGASATSEKITSGEPNTTTGALFDFNDGTAGSQSLGTISTSTNSARFGAILVNNTTTTLTAFSLSYTGEEWWNNNGTSTGLNFSYELGAAGLPTDSSGTTVASLGFTAPATSGGGVYVDGSTTDQTPVSGVVSGLSWAPGQTLAIYWDKGAAPAGSSVGLGVANLSFSASAGPAITSAASATAMDASTSTFQVTTTGSPTSYALGGAPSWVTINSSGLLNFAPPAGTVSTSTNRSFTITATDSGGPGLPQTFTLTELPDTPTITSASSDSVYAGVVPSAFLITTTSPTSTTFSVTPALPSWASLNTSNGAITFTAPSAVSTTATTTYTLTATNSYGTGPGQAFTLSDQPTINFSGSSYTQNFGTLPTTTAGVTTGTDAGPDDLTTTATGAFGASGLTGWYGANTAGSAEKYAQGEPATTTGALYDFNDGTAGSQSLGVIATTANAPRFGALLVNNTGQTQTQFSLSYTGEEWWDNTGTGTGLNFYYTIGGTGLPTSVSTGTVVPTLGFTAPDSTQAGVAVDGFTTTADQVAVTGTVTGISWAPGQTLAIFWDKGAGASGSDGLGIANITLTTPSPAPTLSGSPVVNGNNSALAGVQRSMVDSIVYTFSEGVNLASNAFSIALNTQFSSGTIPTLSWTAVNGSNNTQWAVTFSGNGVTAGNSIGDGVYDITLNGSAVSSSVGSVAYTGGNRTDTFYCLYGDGGGYGKVNNADYGMFAGTYGLKSTNPSFLAYFDTQGLGKISNSEYGQFAANYGVGFKSVSSYVTI